MAQAKLSNIGHWTLDTQPREHHRVCVLMMMPPPGAILVFESVGVRDATQELSCTMKNYHAFYMTFESPPGS